MYGNTVLIPLLVQVVLGKNTVISVITALLGAILAGSLSAAGSRLYGIYPIRTLVGIGLVVDIIGTIGRVAIGAHSPVLTITLFQATCQSGLVTMLIPLQT